MASKRTFWGSAAGPCRATSTTDSAQPPSPPSSHVLTWHSHADRRAELAQLCASDFQLTPQASASPAARIYADWGYAARVGGEVVGCEFFTQNTGPYAHFSYLVRNVNTFFKTVSSSQLKSQSRHLRGFLRSMLWPALSPAVLSRLLPNHDT